MSPGVTHVPADDIAEGAAALVPGGAARDATGPSGESDVDPCSDAAVRDAVDGGAIPGERHGGGAATDDALPGTDGPTAGELWRDGLWDANPGLVTLLGLCPLLAVGNTTVNALGLGLATLATLLVSSVSASLLRGVLPPPIRLPVHVLVIASAVTVVELSMQAWLPALHAALGIFLPLIVTNCLILGRAQAFASRQPVAKATIDALASGLGFLAVLLVLGAGRELIGQGTLLADAARLFGDGASGWTRRLFAAEHGLLLALLPPGAFIALGLLLAARNVIETRRSGRTALRSDEE